MPRVHKDARRIVEQAKRIGYRAIIGAKHLRLRAPDGKHTVTIGGNRSNHGCAHKIRKNLMDDFKRMGRRK